MDDDLSPGAEVVTETRKLSVPEVGAVYVVESGSYSDYRVHFACPDKKTAEAMSAALNKSGGYDSYEVAELAVYSAVEQITPRTLFVVEVDINGNELKRWNSSFRPWDGHGYLVGWIPAYKHVRGISERSYEAALKSARDHLAKRKAKKAGVA